MALIRFTNPVDIPAYSSWEFDVLAAEIVLQAKDLCGIYSAYLTNHQRYHSRIPQHWPRYREAIRVAELLAMLRAAIEREQEVVLDGRDYLWSFASALMFDGKFVSAECPACQKTFDPHQCKVLSWSFGSDLAAEGGRRVVCPAGHTLYACGEWNS